MCTPLAHVHATPSSSTYAPRDLVRCTSSIASQFLSSVAGEKHAQTKPRREKRAQNLQASPTEVSPRPSLFSGALLPVTLTACGLRRR